MTTHITYKKGEKKLIFTKSTPKVSKAIKKYVKKAVAAEVEHKYTNVQVNGYYMCRDIGGGAGTLAAYWCLTDSVSQALGDTNARTGDQIHPTELDLRFMCGTQASSTAGNGDATHCRVIVFQWHDFVDTQNKVGSDLNAILNYTNILNTGPGGVIGPLSPYDIDRQRNKEFKILYDKLFNLNKNLTTSAYVSDSHLTFHKKIKLKRKINFANESTTNAAGHIFVLAMSNITYSTTENPLIYWGCQIKYMDA